MLQTADYNKLKMKFFLTSDILTTLKQMSSFQLSQPAKVWMKLLLQSLSY